jgi:hypothetical protein
MSAPSFPIPPLATKLVEILQCVCENIETYGAGPVCWCGLYPGDSVAWDACGECDNGHCGMAYVKPGIAVPYQTFPVAQLDASCSWPISHSIEVGIVRCFPTSEDDGTPASADAVTEATLNMALDQAALYRAIRCCSCSEIALAGWQPLGPLGNCVGGAWTMWIDPSNG